MAFHYHYSISKSPYQKMANAPSNSTRNQRKKTLFVHYKSAIPKKSKTNFIRNERKRIEERCSTQTATTKHQNAFDDILRLNGYPENSIHQEKCPQNHRLRAVSLSLENPRGKSSRARVTRERRSREHRARFETSEKRDCNGFIQRL